MQSLTGFWSVVNFEAAARGVDRLVSVRSTWQHLSGTDAKHHVHLDVSLANPGSKNLPIPEVKIRQFRK